MPHLYSKNGRLVSKEEYEDWRGIKKKEGQSDSKKEDVDKDKLKNGSSKLNKSKKSK